jgi:DNA modification methylase
MKYLIKMITPPGGIVLDMFAGSGSTCVAADDMGFGYIGIDQELDNCKIAEQRLKGKLKGNSSLDAYNNV